MRGGSCDFADMPAKRRKRRNPPARIAPSQAANGSQWRDLAHLALLLGALVLAYLLPFELFLLSYAVLGPAHYLTEISWLHDRRYFLPHPALAALLCLVALGAMFMADSSRLGLLISVCFVGCAILAAGLPPRRAALLLALAAIGFGALAIAGVPFGLAWVLVPTLLHVSVFTLVFMLGGALKSRSPAQFLLVGAYLVAIAAILILPPSGGTVLPALARIGREDFGDLAPALGQVIGLPDLRFDARLTGLLSFVYTYHYLNWFIKADVIRWTAVPPRRLAAIAVLSLAATGFYLYDYAAGFMVLLLLSLIHVLLEFPLNSISLRQLGGALLRPSRALR